MNQREQIHRLSEPRRNSHDAFQKTVVNGSGQSFAVDAVKTRNVFLRRTSVAVNATPRKRKVSISPSKYAQSVPRAKLTSIVADLQIDNKIESSELPEIRERQNEWNMAQSGTDRGLNLPSYMTKTINASVNSPLLNSRKLSQLVKIKQGRVDPIGIGLLTKLDPLGMNGNEFDMVKIRGGQAFDEILRPKNLRGAPF